MSPPSYDRADLGELPPGRGAALVFVMLVATGLAFLTPCVLLPEWQTYQSLDLTAQVEQHELDRLNRLIDRERERLEALCRDPAVVARLAQRDLRFRRSGTSVIPVSAPIVPAAPADTFVPVPAAPPDWVRRFHAFLPTYDYARIFRSEDTRVIVMIMSLGLIVVAFAVFRPQHA